MIDDQEARLIVVKMEGGRKKKRKEAWEAEIRISKRKGIKSITCDHLCLDVNVYQDSSHFQLQICVKSIGYQRAIIFFKAEKELSKEMAYVFVSSYAGVMF